MKRKEFVALALGLGASCCASATGLAQSGETKSPELEDLERKIEFMQKRIARLIRALDEPARQEVLETMGRECAKESGSFLERFRGKPDEFLEEARKQWVESATYDREAGTVRIVGHSKPCACAFVKPGLTPADFCNCSLGWQKEFYSAIFGEPVDAELEQTVLRGASYCASRISRQK